MVEEKQKMLSGELYNAADPVLANERMKARLLQKRYNDLGAVNLQLEAMY